VEIRPVSVGDVEALQRNCFSLTTVDQTRDMVQEAIDKIVTGEGAMLVVDHDGEAMGCVTVSRNAHRLQRHRAHLGGLAEEAAVFDQVCLYLLIDNWLRST
jgi:hypothetical protein